MDIILKKDLPGRGFKNDIIKVKNGYARNFLIPNGYAEVANESNRKIHNENLKQSSHKLEKVKNDANELSKKIGDLVLKIPVNAGKEDKIFGSVTTQQVSEKLEKENFNIHRRNISINGKTNKLGEYKVNLILHKEVNHEITIELIKGKSIEKETKTVKKKEETKTAKKKEETKTAKKKK
ncbi:MAG: 50S ribosomal protein L9 [Euryarchaeota archaeon]|nr:50S ribosomal protein L9 [Euryarchaeota archaeon]